MRTPSQLLPLSLTCLLLAAQVGCAPEVEQKKAAPSTAPVVAKTPLEQKRDEKFEEEWFIANAWTNDYDVARERAKESGKFIFAYFTRSYAI